MVKIDKDVTVTPHVGVWIETVESALFVHRVNVTPHVGVWIETCKGVVRDGFR